MEEKSYHTNKLLLYYSETNEFLKSIPEYIILYQPFSTSKNFVKKSTTSENKTESPLITEVNNPIQTQTLIGKESQSFQEYHPELDSFNYEPIYQNQINLETFEKKKFNPIKYDKKFCIYNEIIDESSDSNVINYYNIDSKNICCKSNQGVDLNYKENNYINYYYNNDFCNSKYKYDENFPQTKIIEESLNININSNKNTNINNILTNLNQPTFIPSKYHQNNNQKKISLPRRNENENERDKDNESSTELTSSSTSNKGNNDEQRLEVKNIKNKFIKEKEESNDYLVEMFGKKGWICKLCHNFNYESRKKCNRCLVLKLPETILGFKFKKKEKKDNSNNNNGNKGRGRKKDDWFCINCRNLNYAFRKVCNRCNAPKTYSLMSDMMINTSLNYFENNIINTNIINNDNLLYRPLFEPNNGL